MTRGDRLNIRATVNAHKNTVSLMKVHLLGQQAAPTPPQLIRSLRTPKWSVLPIFVDVTTKERNDELSQLAKLGIASSDDETVHLVQVPDLVDISCVESACPLGRPDATVPLTRLTMHSGDVLKVAIPWPNFLAEHIGVDAGKIEELTAGWIKAWKAFGAGDGEDA